MAKEKPVHKVVGVLDSYTACAVFIFRFYHVRRIRITGLWDKTTCKNCLRRKPKGREK